MLELLALNISEDGQSLPDNAVIAQLLRPHLSKMGKMAKKAMPFAQLIRDRFRLCGPSALKLELEMDEHKVIQSNLDYLSRTLGLRIPNGLQVI